MSHTVVTINNSRLGIMLCYIPSWLNFLLGNISSWDCKHIIQMLYFHNFSENTIISYLCYTELSASSSEII